jgi:hypothetical protein
MVHDVFFGGIRTHRVGVLYTQAMFVLLAVRIPYCSDRTAVGFLGGLVYSVHTNCFAWVPLFAFATCILQIRIMDTIPLAQVGSLQNAKQCIFFIYDNAPGPLHWYACSI